MDAIVEFLHMGGYAFYVWTSYAIVAALMAVNLIVPLRRDRRVRERLRRQFSTGAQPQARNPGETAG